MNYNASNEATRCSTAMTKESHGGKTTAAVVDESQLLIARLTTIASSKSTRILFIVCLCILNCVDFASHSSSFEQKAAFIEQLKDVENNTSTTTAEPTIDIVSVGSLLKASNQNAQQATFGSHHNVRNFYRITEANDHDQDCYMKLTTYQIDDVINFCSNTNLENESYAHSQFRRFLFNPRRLTGWICAQKRPVDGLYHALNQYKQGLVGIPEYLFIIDDDTYMSMDSLPYILRRDFPSNVPSVVTGCNFNFLGRLKFTFPYGGFGTFISQASIERLIRPINCTTTSNGEPTDPFTRLTCWRLQNNLMGELPFFQDGMSIGDLMFAYAAEQPFGDAKNWKTGSGFCMHSDHALAYFMNFYHIAVPDHELKDDLVPNDNLRASYKYTALIKNHLKGSEGECKHERDKCTVDSHVCHYVEPDQMHTLHIETEQKRRNAVNNITNSSLTATAV